MFARGGSRIKAVKARTLALLSLVPPAWYLGAPTGPAAVGVGQPAPDFALPDATGRPVRLADYRGKKPVVLAVSRGSW